MTAIRLTALGLSVLLFCPARTSAQMPMTHNPQAAGHVMFHNPRWSPDGKWIVASGNLDGDAEIYLFPVTGGRGAQLTSNDVEDEGADWTTDGRIVFQSARNGSAQWWRMNRDGSGAAVFTPDSASSRSPDGTTLLFERMDDSVGAVFTTDRTRGTTRRITGPEHAEQASFSPDGRAIVFERRRVAHQADLCFSDIVVMKADGSEPRALARGTDPSWSPDGSTILFKTPNPDCERLAITTMRADGSGLRKLAPGVHPHWSPDGRHIAFMRDGAARTDIWVMDAKGGNLRCLSCRTGTP